MNWDALDDDESVSVSCDHGYLLVPENEIIVLCDNETLELIDPPSCEGTHIHNLPLLPPYDNSHTQHTTHSYTKFWFLYDRAES